MVMTDTFGSHWIGVQQAAKILRFDARTMDCMIEQRWCIMSRRDGVLRFLYSDILAFVEELMRTGFRNLDLPAPLDDVGPEGGPAEPEPADLFGAWISIDQAAKILDASHGTVRRLIREKRLTSSTQEGPSVRVWLRDVMLLSLWPLDAPD